MIIKLEKIVNCSSEHPDFPSSNLLQNPSPGPWKCEKPGEMMTHVIFKLSEASNITGVDIGNYRCCIVIVTGSTLDDPDNWIPIVNHQFMSHDEAANNKWKDQVQLFNKKEINSTALNTKFNRIKVTCMQSANRRELFGLLFIILKTEVVLLDIDTDVFGKFKMKNTDDKKNDYKNTFKEKYLRLFPNQKTNYKDDLKDKIKENAVQNFNKRQDEPREPKKRPLLEKLEAGLSDEVFGKKKDDENQTPVKRTPFGDIIPDDEDNKKVEKNNNEKQSESEKQSAENDSDSEKNKKPTNSKINSVKKKKYSDVIDDDDDSSDEEVEKKKPNTWSRLKPQVSDDDECDSDKKCSVCADKTSNKVCKNCNKLPKRDLSESPASKKAKVTKKPKKPFNKLMEDISFSLSGYKNPQRDEIRRKAIKMGAKYIPDPNTTNHKCSHLICAFKNTPKADLLRGHTKIVSHTFIENCHDDKKRMPWRRFALSSKDKKQPESEDEIESISSNPNPYDQDTDPESNSDADY